MENQPIDLLDQLDEREIIYATFWERLLALIVDALVFAPLAIIKLFTDSYWGNQVYMIAIAFIGLIYKPLMEFKYGATLGKMTLKIIVVNKQYNAPSLSNVLLRNIFEIGERSVSLMTVLFSFAGAEIVSQGKLGVFTSLENSFTLITVLSLLPALITIVEIIFLLTDDRNRALHDRIGQTFVIKK